MTTAAAEVLGYIKALDGSPLYCVYHPAAPQVPAPTHRVFPVVIAPPVFEERKSAYATLRKLAERLAAAGFAALRFDYRGSGESGGNPAQRRFTHLAEDLATARKTLAKLTGARDAVLLGVRLGGTLALQETQRVGGEAVVAIAPIINGATQVRMWRMRAKIRAELTAMQGGSVVAKLAGAETMDFDGYPVHPEFFNDIERVELTKDLARLSCPAQLIQVSHRTDPAPESAALQQTLGDRARLACLRMEPFWEKLDHVDTAALEEQVLQALRGL